MGIVSGSFTVLNLMNVGLKSVDISAKQTMHESADVFAQTAFTYY